MLQCSKLLLALQAITKILQVKFPAQLAQLATTAHYRPSVITPLTLAHSNSIALLVSPNQSCVWTVTFVRLMSLNLRSPRFHAQQACTAVQVFSTHVKKVTCAFLVQQLQSPLMDLLASFVTKVTIAPQTVQALVQQHRPNAELETINQTLVPNLLQIA